MKKILLAACATAYVMLLMAAASMVADADCKTLISAGPNGAVTFTCTSAVCDDGSACTMDSSVIVNDPDIGQAKQYYCRCGSYSPAVGCIGFGYISTVNNSWVTSCERFNCAAPCKEWAWPPKAAPQVICDC